MEAVETFEPVVIEKKTRERCEANFWKAASQKLHSLGSSLKNYSRDEAAALIKERGGKTSSSVSKNTDYVLVGEEPGSKYEKAKELKIEILSEEQFKKML